MAKSEGEISNTRVLWYVFLLNLLITIAQAFAAIKSNSLALLMDDIQMGIDTLTYAVNYISEKQREKERESNDESTDNSVELASSGFSIVVLMVSVYGGAVEALSRLRAEDKDAGEVEMKTVLAFAVIGLLVDFLSLYMFYNNDATRSYKSESSEVQPGQLNMCTACLHSGADLLRSTATLICALVTLTQGGGSSQISSSKADAVASLVVSASILIVAVFIAADLAKVAAGLRTLSLRLAVRLAAALLATIIVAAFLWQVGVQVLFAWHPMLMAVGVVGCATNGVLAYSSPAPEDASEGSGSTRINSGSGGSSSDSGRLDERRAGQRSSHRAWLAASGACVAAGYAAILLNKSRAHHALTPASAHAAVGTAALALMLAQGVVGVLKFAALESGEKRYSYHGQVGKAVYAAAAAAAALGLAKVAKLLGAPVASTLAVLTAAVGGSALACLLLPSLGHSVGEAAAGAGTGAGGKGEGRYTPIADAEDSILEIGQERGALQGYQGGGSDAV